MSLMLLALVGGSLLVASAPAHSAMLPFEVVIDSMRTTASGSYAPSGPNFARLELIGRAASYHLSNGSTLSSGAGSSIFAYVTFDHVEVQGELLRFIMRAPADSQAFFRRDFRPGIVASLDFAGPIELVTQRGSNVATVDLVLRVRDNSPTRHQSDVYFLGAQTGRSVPCHVTITNTSAPWTELSFATSFNYQLAGMVDFEHALPPGAPIALAIRGPADVTSPGQSTHRAIASYYGGLKLDVTSDADWATEGLSGATIAAGELTVPEVVGFAGSVRLHAGYAPHAGELTASRDVTVHAGGSAPDADTWPMYQADASHTGYRPVSLHPPAFMTRWSRRIADYGMNAVATAGGRVYCTIVGVPGGNTRAAVALDAQTGATLWTTPVGTPFSVSAPSCSDGLVSFVTCNNDDDTWLWLLREDDGTQVSKVRLDAQWGYYFAPTLFDRTVYTYSGYFGGMFAVRAYDGVALWHDTDLPQVDRWTPAVDEDYVYVHQFSTLPMLIAVDRRSGATAWTIPPQATNAGAGIVDGAPVLGPHRDAVTMQGTSLICYDLDARRVRWKLDRQFFGQPSLANGVVYAIDAGGLVAIDELSHADLWSWRPPAGSLTGAMVVTDSHVLCTTGSATYTVGLASHQSEWSHPMGGALALGSRSLFIANAGGTLAAIDLGDVPTAAFVQRFEGAATAEGITLVWQLGEQDQVERVSVERAANDLGDWQPLVGELEATASGTRFTDHTAASGSSYWYRLRVILRQGGEFLSDPILVESAPGALRHGLVSVGPVPANRSLTITWSLAEPGQARVALLDVQGRIAETLHTGTLPAGLAQRSFALPATLRPGVYLLCFEAGPRREVRRVVVAR